MHIDRDATIRYQLREVHDDHKIWSVFLELPFTVEVQDAPSTDDDGNEITIRSWGVWDERVADWADNGRGVEFLTREEAEEWLRFSLPSLLA